MSVTAETVWASLAVQAVLVVLLALAIFFLAGQLRILHGRIHAAGALSLPGGPKVGDAAPIIEVVSLEGTKVSVGRGSTEGHALLLTFVSPSCPISQKMVPVVQDVARKEPKLDLIIASDGDEAMQRRFGAGFGLDMSRYVLSESLGQRYGIGRVPHAVLIGANGRIAARGLINNREHVESLLAAAELNVASIQDYVARHMPSDSAA